MYHGRDGGRLVSTCWIYCISLWFSLWFEATNGAVSCICVIEVLYEMRNKKYSDSDDASTELQITGIGHYTKIPSRTSRMKRP